MITLFVHLRSRKYPEITDINVLNVNKKDGTYGKAIKDAILKLQTDGWYVTNATTVITEEELT